MSAPPAIEQWEISVGMHPTTRNPLLLRLLRRSLVKEVWAITTVLVLGCDGGVPPAPTPQFGTTDSPASPSPPASASAFIWAMVLEDAGGCIPGATIQVLAGPGAGATIVQDTQCNAWGYGGGVWFFNLPGVVMTLRASADGYCPMTKTAVTASTAFGAVEFGLTRNQPNGCT